MNEGLNPHTLSPDLGARGIDDNEVAGLRADIERGEKYFWKRRGVDLEEVNRRGSMRAQIRAESTTAMAQRAAARRKGEL